MKSATHHGVILQVSEKHNPHSDAKTKNKLLLRRRYTIHSFALY